MDSGASSNCCQCTVLGCSLRTPC